MSRDRSVELTEALSCRTTLSKLTGALSCRTTLFKFLRHNLLSLQQVQLGMERHKPDLLLFRTIARTGDLSSKHALGIL